jgi:anti-sigma regulatory factor (Ser/Thr protein kinase)
MSVDLLSSTAVATLSAAPTALAPDPHHVLVAVDLTAGAEAAAQARRVVRDLLERGRQPALVDTACLLTSELVTNAVVHAGAPVELIVDLDRVRLAVEVVDASDAPLRPTHAEPMDTGGRGLELVALLADAWGVTTALPGKSVWFSLATG